MMGFCGEELKTKEWKQGTSVECEKIEAKVVSYPNNGIKNAITKLCHICRFSPYRRSSQEATKESKP